jgi:serine/threonine protein kinase
MSGTTCPSCQAPVPDGAPEGLCARCLGRSFAELASEQRGKLTVTQKGPAHCRFFADYELLEEVGRGGAGVVFKARQLGLSRIVALKLLSAGPTASRDYVHRFYTEAEAAARLNHPHITSVYDFGEHEGSHYLAMPFFEGGTLQARIAKELPDSQAAARIMRDVAHGVEHAHCRGVLHRDLKRAIYSWIRMALRTLPTSAWPI